MNRGPKAGAASDQRTYVQKANDAWGFSPDWVLELATFTDQNGAKAAGAAIGYGNTVVSQIINNKYPGDVSRVEQMVRGALMALVVDCPILGDIGRDRCLQEQKEEFRATSAMRAQLYYACRNGCPHYRDPNRNSQPEGGQDAQ